ncbi:putative baseplate assembly protein [uncultured Chloroflexus sp.]|uniref:putative baseplate assembly protein n=1 Tax=uncultured Chloroflexus sp. TaxID=214040 RepID=UPI002610873A|nr:putative baseplate assembly protein [uncultured Chloroflexus sp.]
MSIQFRCANPRRAQVLSTAAIPLNGIDLLEVLDRDAPAGAPPQQTLLVQMIKSAPLGLSVANVQITGGVRVAGIQAIWVLRAADAGPADIAAGRITNAERTFYNGLAAADRTLVVRVNQAGDFSAYTLRLVRSPTDPIPPAGFDPILSSIEFSFKVECPSEFDCAPAVDCPPESDESPPIDYLARDYASLRQLLFDRLATVSPDWRERNPADLGVAIVEGLAYIGDYLSYYQDAVATEAYLGTARRRVSLRRHARLLDYAPHDGANARVWVQVQVDAPFTLSARTPMLTKVGGAPLRLLPNSTELALARQQQPLVFETMHRAHLDPALNQIDFYLWGDEECCLPAGSTRATLRGDLSATLRPGDVLVFIEQRHPQTGYRADADPTRRYAVRLTRVIATTDPLGGQFADPPSNNPLAVTEIEWMDDDALPFILDLTVVSVPPDDRDESGELRQAASVALGNIVLADHGATLPAETLPPVVDPLRYRPALAQVGVTFAAPFEPVDRTTPASRLVSSAEPGRTLPVVALTSASGLWRPVPDLLSSNRFQPEFVGELENDGRLYLRFGDGRTGRAPAAGEALAARYRVGGGSAGNIGADALAHIVTNESGIRGVRNPLPALGGSDPESPEAIRQYAPHAFRRQERAVTPADYATMAERHPSVQRAVATRRWTGSWYTIFITIDRRSGLPVDAAFETELRAFLERYRMAGQDIEIDGPIYVPLDLAFVVCVEAGYFAANVKAALLERFSTRQFFHPDNFTFGQSLYLSHLIATAMAIPGVRWIDTAGTRVRFQRWGKMPRGELANGQLDVGQREIIRCDNNPNRPEHGRIEFIMEGGS